MWNEKQHLFAAVKGVLYTPSARLMTPVDQFKKAEDVADANGTYGLGLQSSSDNIHCQVRDFSQSNNYLFPGHHKSKIILSFPIGPWK
jgi:hypothetical protein